MQDSSPKSSEEIFESREDHFESFVRYGDKTRKNKTTGGKSAGRNLKIQNHKERRK